MLNSPGLPNGRSNGLGRMAWDLQIGRPMYNSNIRPGLGSFHFQKFKKSFLDGDRNPVEEIKEEWKYFYGFFYDWSLSFSKF